MAAYQQAMRLVRNTGTVVCVGLVSEDLPISPFEMLVRGQQNPCLVLLT